MNQELSLEKQASSKLLVLLLIAFAVLAGARLNQFYFYNPDSPGYVIMARGLVDHFEYRQFDAPDEPYFTLRPPGMPVLLIPAALIAPYNVFAAKVTVILTGLAMIWVFYALAWRLIQSAEPASPEQRTSLQAVVLVVALVLVTNPYTLLYSTIVMSEIPFAACSLAILYLVSGENERWSLRRLACLSGLLIFLPFLRTIGVALILAVGLWSVIDRKRWPCLISVVLSLLTTGLWMWRNSQYDSISYSKVAMNEFKAEGTIGTIVSMANRMLVHFEGLGQKLFPGMPGAIPEYSGLIAGDFQYLPGSSTIYAAASLVVYMLAFAGMLKCWKRGGAVSFLYLLFSFGVLSLWPWLQMRFTLPLLPVVLVFVPAGLIYLKDQLLKDQRVVYRVFCGGMLAAALALILVQSRTDYGLVTTNRQLLTASEDDLALDDLIIYASDYIKAGEWLKKHSDAHARVLTQRVELSTTSHRFQKPGNFDSAKTEQMHSLIQSVGARYLVSYGKYITDLFPRHLIDNDLIYRLDPIYDESGVMILEVKPNYEGTIRKQYWRENEAMEHAKRALERNPHRISACMNYLNQLMKDDQYDETIAYIKKLEQQEVNDAKLVVLLGWSYIGKKQYGQALQEFSRASRMPGQKLVREFLVRGIRLAQKKVESGEAEGELKKRSVAGNLRLAEKMWEIGMFHKTEEFVQKVFAAEDASQDELDQAHVFLARLALIQGETDRAVAELKKVRDDGNEEAQKYRERIALEKNISGYLTSRRQTRDPQLQQLDAKRKAQVFKLASLYEEQGVPGKTLALLEQVHTLDPSDQQILKRLAKWQLFYLMLPEAEASYLALKQAGSDDQEVQEGLARITELKQVPRL